MARKNPGTSEVSLKIISAGIVVAEGDDLQLYSWQSVLQKLGDAGSDLSLHIDWGSDCREDVFDWAETLTFQNEVGTLEHGILEDGRNVASAACVVEFEKDRVRFYYEGEDGAEAGITTIFFEGGDFLDPSGAEFLAFGESRPRRAEAVWFSGSLAL